MAQNERNSARRGASRGVWLTLLVLAVAVVVYFLFFTRTPEEGTRTGDTLQPAEQSETPGVPASGPAGQTEPN